MNTPTQPVETSRITRLIHSLNHPILWLAGFWALLVIVSVTLESVYSVQIPLCSFKRVTGWPCATCGGTTATKALLTGHVASALIANPLVTIVYLLGAIWLGGCLWSPQCRQATLTMARGRRVWVGLLMALGANWMYLIVQHWMQGA